MIVKLLTEHHFEFRSLIGGCRGSSESNLSESQIVGNLMLRLICLISSTRALHDKILFEVFIDMHQHCVDALP